MEKTKTILIEILKSNPLDSSVTITQQRLLVVCILSKSIFTLSLVSVLLGFHYIYSLLSYFFYKKRIPDAQIVNQ